MNNAFGTFLKDRRTRLDPIALGMDMTRRRTPGLRREEVASRAAVSPTWYTWLEQGRGGAPSAPVLERISRALMLTDAEREHLFLLGLGRPPGPQTPLVGDVTPRLQRLLDAFPLAAAMLRTPTWDIVGWNEVCKRVLHDYGAMPPEKRNIIRMLFTNPSIKKKNPNWERDAHFVVASFRTDVTRAGATQAMENFITELCRDSADFNAIWHENEVLSMSSYGEKPKLIHHPVLGKMELEYSAFAVEGRPDLILVVYNPATEADREKIRRALA